MSTKFTRRALARLLAGSAAVATFARKGIEAETTSTSSQGNHSASRAFPKSFIWGAGTSAYQVEGAVREAGRGLSIWDTFSRTAGKTHNAETGDVAADFFHRYKDDIQIMKNLGLKSFRFSIAWPRIFPNGVGMPNPQGLDFYHRMIDALLEADIQPFCTLYHWDLPQALQNKGGWENRDTAKAFADYAGYTACKLAGKVKHFMTMNEMRTFVEQGYALGTHAPGLRLDATRVAQLSHYVALGHGLAVQAIRALAMPDTKIGIADNVIAATPAIESGEHIEAARKAMREENAMYLTVLQEGLYTDQYLKRLGSCAPKFTAEEMRIICSPLDFIGINIYQPTYVRADDSEIGYSVVSPPASFPHMISPWLSIGPEAIYWSAKLVSELWGVKEMFVTENGASSADRLARGGAIYDTDRVMFLRNYLTQLHRAVSEGVPVKGYFLWSILDNFEWSDGYGNRFGIIYVDFATQKRTPKLSAGFYQQVINENFVC
jgi:beta-glucosidase